MKFKHCDREEKYILLHDCKATHAYFKRGVLGFDFEDGFWVTPEHPCSELSELVRSDFSKVEYVLENGDEYDVIVYVFKKSLFGITVRTEWTVRELVRKINRGECKLEFLYQYIDGVARIVECSLSFRKKPYHGECLLKIYAPAVNYCWNDLCADRPW